ncbi:MAG: hypothetical protein IAE90_07390 [Ignavibacteria bacterium]|nr:hypothetical protein [Ignavibacteria bacterium]
MKVESKSYIQDVMKIKSMPRSAERRQLAEYFARKHETSYETIMRDARKKVNNIGVRKKRSDAGKDKVKPPKKDLIMFNELIKAGKTKAEAISIIAEEHNKKISERTKTKMSKKLEALPESDKTSFGSEVKKDIEKIWKLDKIAPGMKIKMRLGGKIPVKLSRSAIDHIKNVIAVEINKNQIQETKKIQFDGDAFTREMLKLMLHEQMFIASENNSLEAIGQISLILQRLDIAADLKNCNPNFAVMYKVITNKYKADATKEEVAAYIEEFKPIKE